MTGLSTAFWLTENGIKDIVILDVRGVAEGATGRNGGHLWAYTELPTSEGTFCNSILLSRCWRSNLLFDALNLLNRNSKIWY